jgi:hypothetical protein
MDALGQFRDPLPSIPRNSGRSGKFDSQTIAPEAVGGSAEASRTYRLIARPLRSPTNRYVVPSLGMIVKPDTASIGTSLVDCKSFVGPRETIPVVS